MAIKYNRHLLVTLLSVLLTLSGCTLTGSPRCRNGYYPSSNWDTSFIDANNLGYHNYDIWIGENDGVVYTCSGGTIDIGHLRIAADNVYYLYHKVYDALEDNETDFSYKLNVDRSLFNVHIDYPPGFKQLSKSDRQAVIHVVSCNLAQYFTWNMITWHEILTWFGFKPLGVISDFESAFSWEDNYSNLLGTLLGGQAVCDPNHRFNETMTRNLKRELVNLGIQSRDTAYKASEKVREKWYTGRLFAKMKLRHLDLGFDDGFVSPMLIEGICEGAQPRPYPVPKLDFVESLGFKVKLTIVPREFESGRVLQAAHLPSNPGTVIPQVHIPILIEHIKTESIKAGEKTFP